MNQLLDLMQQVFFGRLHAEFLVGPHEPVTQRKFALEAANRCADSFGARLVCQIDSVADQDRDRPEDSVLITNEREDIGGGAGKLDATGGRRIGWPCQDAPQRVGVLDREFDLGCGFGPEFAAPPVVAIYGDGLRQQRPDEQRVILDRQFLVVATVHGRHP